MEAHSEPEPTVLAELRRATYLRMLRPRMLSGNMQGQLLKLFCRMIGAKCVLEIGTYTGYAALSMAEAVGNDGKVYTVDINDEVGDIVREYVAKSGYADRVHFLTGDACEVVPSIVERAFDMVFIDADKRQYAEYYHMVIDRVRPGGLVVADDVLWEGKVLTEDDAQTRGIMAFNDLVASDMRVEKLILPVRHGLMVARKK